VTFGGGNSKTSHPKMARPFSRKCFQHVILKSSQAKGNWSFLLKDRIIKEKVRTLMLGKSFWDARPFSTLITESSYLWRLRKYFELNRFESSNNVSRTATRTSLASYYEQKAYFSKALWNIDTA
jgi:hypothetical protein